MPGMLRINILLTEESVKPKQLVSLIKDTAVTVLDDKIKEDIKASKKKKKKKRRKKRK